MIINIVNANRDTDASAWGMTLIVAKSSIIAVWEQEIKKHVESPRDTLGKQTRFSYQAVKRLYGVEDVLDDAVEFLKQHKIVYDCDLAFHWALLTFSQVYDSSRSRQFVRA